MYLRVMKINICNRVREKIYCKQTGAYISTPSDSALRFMVVDSQVRNARSLFFCDCACVWCKHPFLGKVRDWPGSMFSLLNIIVVTCFFFLRSVDPLESVLPYNSGHSF